MAKRVRAAGSKKRAKSSGTPAKSAVVRPYEALLRSGFIGCGSGEPNDSTDYKRILTESLARKHGLDP